ncbi:hypothetical protein NHQ30_004362 [Ciborinia camelliae]|nr:hypothetical protein NHQ30_004362 [Ciborinia camelliae]
MPFQSTNEKSLFYTLTPQTSHLEKRSTILMIHGLGSSSTFFHTLIPLLSPRATCITFDTPGSGFSNLGDPAQPQTVDSIVDDVLALLDVLLLDMSMRKVWVVAHSMGALIASELALRCELRRVSFQLELVGLVLLGPIYPSVSLSEVFEKRIAAVLKAKQPSNPPTKPTEGISPLANTIPISATGTKATSAHHLTIRNLILGTTPSGYISLCRVIASAHPPDYTKIHIPLLILAGGDDHTASFGGCQRIYEQAGVREEKKCLRVLQGVGHWHAVEDPESVGMEIAGFLERIAGMEDMGER